MSRATWLVSGTFDVANYGDLLFPRLLARDLGADVDVAAVSPLGGRPVVDALEALSFDAAERLERVERVVIGGGNIVHAEPETAVYGPAAPTAHADLWARALTIAQAHGAPLVWNAPGVPTSFGPVAAERLRETARRSAYVSVRDAASRDRLLEAGVDVEVHVRPDPAWTLDTLWSDDELAAAFEARGGDPAARHLALHVGPHRAHESTAEIAGGMASLARALDARPLLVSIGACHDDGAMLRAAAEALVDDGLDPLVVVDDDPVPLRDVAAAVSRSVAYAGASMHGAITAMSFGRPALIVAEGGGHKMASLCATLDATGRWVRSWRRAPERVALLDAAHAPAIGAIADANRRALAEHRAALTDPTARAPDGPPLARPSDDLPWVREILAASLEQLGRHRHLIQSTKRWARGERLRLVDERDVQRHVALRLRADVQDLRTRRSP